MWENSHLNPRELTSFFGALSPLAMGGGTLPSPAQDFKRQSHDRSRGSTCSSQVQGQSARIKAGLGTAMPKIADSFSRFRNKACEHSGGRGITDCTSLWSCLFNHEVALVRN